MNLPPEIDHICGECGAQVAEGHMSDHVTWHNELSHELDRLTRDLISRTDPRLRSGE